MTSTKKVLPIGTQVQLVDVDSYAFQGRDYHPKRTDVGFLGFITKVLDCGDEDDNIMFNPPPGTEYDEEGWCVYKVSSPSGQVLELVDYEIEVLH